VTSMAHAVRVHADDKRMVHFADDESEETYTKQVENIMYGRAPHKERPRND
jgi:hypothetical protein